tara:strand:- start:3799 stop:4782 length:984 start_codon:yes stop_codon:yes gene_type:complete
MVRNISVLGLGSAGLRHAKILLDFGQNVSGYDPDPSRQAELCEAGGRASGDREATLDGSEAIVIASPNQHHFGDLKEAVARGTHVFVEKPLAHTELGVAEVLRDAERQGLTVFAGLNLRYRDVVRAGKSILDSGAIGNPLWGRFLCASYLPEWRPASDYRKGYAADPCTGGVLFDVIHEFDLANFMLGAAQTVAAAARNSGCLEIAAEDCADVILQHLDGPFSTLHLDYVSRPRQRLAEIAGTEGALRLDLVNRTLVQLDAAGETVDQQTYKGKPIDEYQAEMRDFIDCIDGKSEPICTGTEAFGVLQQVISARRMCQLPETSGEIL